jgi:ribosome-binding factor A
VFRAGFKSGISRIKVRNDASSAILFVDKLQIRGLETSEILNIVNNSTLHVDGTETH